MRILLVTGSYPPGRCGVGDYTRLLATTLATLPDTAVSVLTTGECATGADEQGVFVLRFMPDWSLLRAGALFRHIFHARPDIVHVQYPTHGYSDGGLPWLVPLIAWCCGARVVQTWHEVINRRDLAKFLFMMVVPGRTVVVRKTYLQQTRWPFDLLTRWRRPQYINSASTLPKAHLSPSQLMAVREDYQVGAGRMIVFFGFLHPSKRVELLFDVADPATDHILIVGNAGDQADYVSNIERLSQDDRWLGRSRVIGFVEAEKAAVILKTADAVVLPLQLGGGEWNTSIRAGVLQGTFVLTTSTLSSGYDAEANIYYARIDDVEEMRRALQTYAGVKRDSDDPSDTFGWMSIAKRHLALYRSMLPVAHSALNSPQYDAK